MLIKGYDYGPLVAGEWLLERAGFWSNHLLAMCRFTAGETRPAPEWFGDDGADTDALSEVLQNDQVWPAFRLPFQGGHSAVVAELGPDVPLDVIARRAGVGNATLYRHFPSREPLVEAVYRDDVARLTEQALDLAGQYTPAVALERWVREALIPAQQQPGLTAALSSALTRAPELFSESKQRFNDAADQLVTAAQADGAVRADVSTNDVLRMASGLALASVGAAGTLERMLTVMFDGLASSG
ncbi:MULTISPECIES: TetR/AcrR family transcriptional regulator [Streptacidiphilus]|uniref:TetR/AcrR family transcriptional regulator n=1 Tax=Streptacidiphilus cavernicola TaxID=3342716 RepID=A0ABV6UQ22_9ACTN|nr:TetR/AcrR family transcriptional regulator [Streptacidiphilus jeojiense]